MDAIVNATNYSLLGGGTVDGTRGKGILEGCRKILKGVTKIILIKKTLRRKVSQRL